MRILISTLLVLASSFALANTSVIDVRGNGSDVGLCEGNAFAWSCINRVEQRAEDNGQRDAEYQCYAKQGRVISAFGYCSTWCMPSSLPQDDQFHHVQCNANCSVRCEIQD